MLVLSRKSGEQIHIGENITIEIRRVSGNRVALAVQAPRDMRILRGELKEAVESFHEEEDGAEVLMLKLHEADCRTAASA